MRQDFPQEVERVLIREGGYVNDPSDRGGETNWGITHATLDHYNAIHGLPRSSVRDLTRDGAKTIYLELFWIPSGGDVLPYPLDALMFDAAVNHGPAQAVIFLQRAVGANEDGALGPRTLAAIASADMSRVLSALLNAREGFYRWLATQPDQAKFLRGWLNRLDGIRKTYGILDSAPAPAPSPAPTGSGTSGAKVGLALFFLAIGTTAIATRS